MKGRCWVPAYVWRRIESSPPPVLLRLRIGCFTMHRKCKIQLRTLKSIPMNLVIRLVIFYMLFVEGIESSPTAQTWSTRGNSSPRDDPRGCGCGCNGHGSDCGSGQDPIDDAFADTFVCNSTGLVWATQ